MRPTFAEIDLKAIRSNLLAVRNHTGVRVMAVVKANAYGHGMLPVVQSMLRHTPPDYFGVALIEEAVELRQAGVHIPILVFSAPAAAQSALFVEHEVDATVCSLETARRLNRCAADAGMILNVHIKVDTGMGRIGIQPGDAAEFAREMRKLHSLRVIGLFMHFATSDEADLSFAHRQLETFRAVRAAVIGTGINLSFTHCANSGAIMQMPDSYFDMVRPGIMLYGYPPSHETKQTVALEPAMSLKSFVSFVKTVPAGTSISYNRRYTTQGESVIATVPIGYADGIHRSMLNKAKALVGGGKFPVAGTICMDQLMVDLGARQASVGDEVVLMGTMGKERITAWDIADAAGTIPYEVTCAISNRVPRKYVNG